MRDSDTSSPASGPPDRTLGARDDDQGVFRRGSHGRGGRGRRASRGDVRAAVLLLLLDEGPMHGYQLMQAVADRTRGRWTPSPGAIYPTINQLEDEGLVTVTADAGRRLAALTDAGRQEARTVRGAPGEPFGVYDQERPGVDLRSAVEQVHGAVREIGRVGTDRQRAAAAGILAEARRSLYLVLADGADETSADEAPRSQGSGTGDA